MRKVYLDNLPRITTGRNSGNINWNKSIGFVVKFEYDNIIGSFTILSYEAKRKCLDVLYNDRNFKVFTPSLINSNIYKLVNEVPNNSNSLIQYAKYNIKDIVKINTGDIKILRYVKINKNKFGYFYECMNCHYTGRMSEYNLKCQFGCPICTNQKVKIGINDMWTTNPDKAKLLANPEDGYKYTQGSDKKVNWKCPECGDIIKNKKISHINPTYLVCVKCSDGISYPEKFVFNLLQQLNVNFEKEKTFEWSKNLKHSNKNFNGIRRYDFYLRTENMIIEVHGGQHYHDAGFLKYGGKTLAEEQENDRLKEQAAKNNGIDKYIIIDARLSKFEHIKNSIIKSEISKIFDLSIVNWSKCNEFACSNLVKEVCNMWNNGIKDTLEISKVTNLHRDTIGRYLTQGAFCGFCNYDAKESRKGVNAKQVICITTNETFISSAEGARQYNISSISIRDNCYGKTKSAGKHPETGEKLIWMYVDDFSTLRANEKLNNINIHKHSKAVVQIDINNERLIDNFYSIKNASEQTGISDVCIQLACKGKLNTSGGFKWMYLEDYNKLLNEYKNIGEIFAK